MEGHGHGVPEVGLAGEDGRRLLVGFDRLFELFALGGFEAEEEPDFGVAGVALDGLAEEGLKGLLRVAEEHGGFEVGGGVGGAVGDFLIKILQCCCVVASGEGEEAEGGGALLALIEPGSQRGFSAGEGEFGDGLLVDCIDLDAGGVEGVAGHGGDGEGAAENPLPGIVDDSGGAPVERSKAGFLDGDAFVEKFGELLDMLAVAGLGVEQVNDGPALGVEEAGAVGFIVDRGVFGDTEELAGREPVDAAEDADMVVNGAADKPAVFLRGDGGIELGDSFFKPEGAAGGGVLEGGVDELVGDGAEVVGAGHDGEEIALGS